MNTQANLHLRQATFSYSSMSERLDGHGPPAPRVARCTYGHGILLHAFAVCAAALVCLPAAIAAENELRLSAAYMCEQITDTGPENRAVVFSVTEGKIFCFCYFAIVPEKTTIYHAWYHTDRMVTRRKLTPEPPAWKGYSSMQLRETDKGAWRVEILDANGKLFDIVRFSVTD